MRFLSQLKFYATAICLIFPYSAAAQEDETDLSRYKVADEGEMVISLSVFQTLEDEARLAVEANDCPKILELAPEVSRKANMLSNIIQQGLEPFYDASYDDRETIPRYLGTQFDEMVEAERAANNLRLIRNEFWAHEAICAANSENPEQALSKLFRALDFVDPLKQIAIWKDLRHALWSIIGYK